MSFFVRKTEKNDSWLTNQVYEKFLFTFFLSTFAEASAASLVLDCLEKSGRLFAAKDNPR